MSSQSPPSQLPSIEQLQTWIHRPQAISKCCIADVFNMRALVDRETASIVKYAKREIFMLGMWPCKMVEFVGWVVGVKSTQESSMSVYLEDGDGKHILCVQVKLPLVKSTNNLKKGGSSVTRTFTFTQSHTHSQSAETLAISSNFLNAKDRKALKRKLDAEKRIAEEDESKKKRVPEKVYLQKDIRVGDVVRVIGRVDEWMRRRDQGRGEEWVREVIVEEGSLGNIVVVDPDEQHEHISQVLRLHETVYSKPFFMPPISAPCVKKPAISASLPSSPEKSSLGVTTISSTAWTDSIDMSSELPSELSITGHGSQLSLRPPNQLRSSQLTDRTFRQYLIDHLTQSTLESIRLAEHAGPSTLRSTLSRMFPEYQKMVDPNFGSGMNNAGIERLHGEKGKNREDRVLQPCWSDNSKSNSNSSIEDIDETPRANRYLKSFMKKSLAHIPGSSFTSTSNISPSNQDIQLKGWTIDSILGIPHLEELASLIVNNDAKRDERRRRRRIQEGNSRARDIQIEEERKARGKRSDEWRLGCAERRGKMEVLVRGCIRGIAEDGGLVQVRVSDDIEDYQSLNGNARGGISHSPLRNYGSKRSIVGKADDTIGYIPLPPELLLHLLLPLLEEERINRSKYFMKKNDPRRGNGMMVDQLLLSLRSWGEDGRWERLGEWSVLESLELGEERGMVSRKGEGWWCCEGYVP